MPITDSMRCLKITILFVFVIFFLSNVTLAASEKSKFDEKTKTLVIYKPATQNSLMTVHQVSAKPDLVTMEEVFKITLNEDYTFKKDKDFSTLWQKTRGKKDIKNSKLEILDSVPYVVTMPDFELIEKNLTISNIQSITDVTDIYEVNPWYLDWGVNSKEKWNITYPGGTGTIGFLRSETTSTDPLNITFFWYENEIKGSHQETRYRDEWKPFLPDGRTIKKDESIVVKITFEKDAEKGKFSIKTIPRFAGVDEDRLTWWNASWDYRIDNPIPNGARPYQISLNLSNSIGTSNATHVFLNGHSNINFTDIRFTLDNATALPYWIDKEAGKVWVNVTANGVVNLYYGNPSATDSSNGMKTFEFFDNFEPESWQKTQKLPVPHADQAGAVQNGKVYTIGGYDVDFNFPVAYVWEYDPVTNSYTSKKNLTFARWGLACTGFNSNIYCFGGQPNPNTEKYDPVTNTWTTLPNLPPAQLRNQGLSAVSGGGFIYLFRGGYLYKYTPSSDSYTLLSSATPQSFTNWASMAFYNNEIYMLGGYSATINGGIDYVQIYNLTNNAWRNGASMPIGLYGTLRENPVINGKIYILQGQGMSSNTDFFSRYWVYDISANSWNWGELGYWDADGVSGGVVGTKIYTFGGRRGHGVDDLGTDFAGVLDTTKNVENKWIDVITGSWREDSSSLQNGLTQYQPTVQIRTSKIAVNANNKVISKLKYSGSSTGYGGLILQSNDLGVPNNNGYLDPKIDITANRDALEKQTSGSITLLGSRARASPDVWHTYTSYYSPSSIRSTRDGAGDIASNDVTYRGGYIQVIKTMGFDLLLDYIAVARYVTPEPVWARWGEELSTANVSDRLSITGYAPASLINDFSGATRSFNIIVNQPVNVNWYINGIPVKSDAGVTNSMYTNTSASAGTWVVNATASNANGTVSREWTWIVAAEAINRKLNIPTYDGSGQGVHPDVYYNANGWNGYRYWMAVTPYPGGNAAYENPSIVVSNDNVNWIVPPGLSNPIVATAIKR